MKGVQPGKRRMQGLACMIGGIVVVDEGGEEERQCFEEKLARVVQDNGASQGASRLASHLYLGRDAFFLADFIRLCYTLVDTYP